MQATAGPTGATHPAASPATALPAALLPGAEPTAQSSQSAAPLAAGASAKPGGVPATLDSAIGANTLPGVMSADALAAAGASARHATAPDRASGDFALAALAETSTLDNAPAESATDTTGLLPTAPTSSAAPSANAIRTVPGAPMGMSAEPQDGFDDGFGARIGWMAEQRVGHAEIRLNPENLGPIDVRVQLDGTRVNAEFHSAHAEVRQAIEASVPRLREMLGQQGLQLGQADVGQRHAGAGQSPGQEPKGILTGDGALTPGEPSAPRLRSRGLVDEYA